MKVILNQDVYNLGEEGDVCDVKRGYARNFLLPKELAFPYTKQYKAIFDSRKEAIEQRKTQKRKDAGSLREKLESIEFNFAMPAGDTGKLFGAVTNLTLSEELAKEGFSIERKKIEIPEHTIKMVGNYTVKIKLYEGETATVKVSITKADDGKKKSEGRKKTDKKAEKAAEDEEVKDETKSEEKAEAKEAEKAEIKEEEKAEAKEEEKAEAESEEPASEEEALEKTELNEEAAEKTQAADEEKTETEETPEETGKASEEESEAEEKESGE